MRIIIDAFHIVLDTLFPRHANDLAIDLIDVSMITRLAQPPVTRLGATVIAPLPYEHAQVRALVHAAKYRGHLRATTLLGEALSSFVMEELSERKMFGGFEQCHVVPIPLHPTRARERGYNQSERIASVLLQTMQDPSMTLARDLLARSKNTPSQARTPSRSARLENMSDAFLVPNPELVAGSYIMLVDDVVTTGATLHAARSVLLQAGAADVLCVAVAH